MAYAFRVVIVGASTRRSMAYFFVLLAQKIFVYISIFCINCLFGCGNSMLQILNIFRFRYYCLNKAEKEECSF